jgi:hypothetical protein
MSGLHKKNSSSFGGSSSLHGNILKESTDNGESLSSAADANTDADDLS